jgi:hypothetical protein
MNNHLHPVFREALRPFSPIDADNVKLGHALRESANDGEPAYIRMPELDRRVAWGDDCNAAAWFSTAKRKAVYLCVNYDANAQRWLPIVEGSEVTR